MTGLSTVNRFAWIGAFSTGSLEPFQSSLPPLSQRMTSQLQLLWLACGTDDNLIATNRKLRDWLVTNGVDHTFAETSGARA